MKKSTNATGSKAKTAAKIKNIDWKRVQTIGIDLGDSFQSLLRVRC
jgi:hypothetical protein